MANIASANGLKPVNLVGGGPFQGGTIRMFPLFDNVATGIFNGQIILIGANGQPVAAGPIMVNDDPNVVMQIQGANSYATLVLAQAAVGSNAAVDGFGGNVATGNSEMSLTNAGNPTATLAFRIMGFVPGTETDTYPEILVKFNFGVHSYNKSTGI